METKSNVPNEEFFATMRETAIEVVEEGGLDLAAMQLIQVSLSGKGGHKVQELARKISEVILDETFARTEEKMQNKNRLRVQKKVTDQ